MIVYASFEVQLSGLELNSMSELESLRQEIDAVVRGHVYPNAKFHDDVAVDIFEYAGDPK